jgi:hypothetical protein
LQQPPLQQQHLAFFLAGFSQQPLASSLAGFSQQPLAAAQQADVFTAVGVVPAGAAQPLASSQQGEPGKQHSEPEKQQSALVLLLE